MIITIEGTDGCGKRTQANLLKENLEAMGKNVKLFSFPNYGSPSSGPVKLYLSGALCEKASDFDAYQSSALFAVDRLCSIQSLKPFIENGGILICDRYVQSNMIHQASKIEDESECNKFLKWLDDFEFNTLKLPRADVVLFLDLPVEISKRLANARQELKSGEQKDIHEQDENHLIAAYNSGKRVAEMFGWDVIKCDSQGNIKTIEEIQASILEKIKKYL